MGLQMACAYVGSTLMSPLFGVLAGVVSLALYPVYLLLIADHVPFDGAGEPYRQGEKLKRRILSMYFHCFLSFFP